MKNILEGAYFSSLDNSLLFDVYSVRNFPGVEQIRNSIFGTLDLSHKKKKKEKECLSNILCNLSLGFARRQCVAVSMNSRDFSGQGRYGRLHMGYTVFRNVVDELEHKGWIHSAKGVSFSSSNFHRSTRIWASEKTQTLFSESGITSKQFVYRESTIVIKDSEGNTIDSPYLNERYADILSSIRARLNKYDNLMKTVCVEYSCKSVTLLEEEEKRRHHSGLPLLIRNGPEEVVKVRIDPSMKCIFNNSSLECLGRLYSRKFGWQNLLRTLRRTITFDGKNTVELDFKTLHPTMLYAKKGIQLRQDAYEIYGDEVKAKGMRPIVKPLLNIIINSSSKREAVLAMDRKIHMLMRRAKCELEDYEAELLDAVKEFNPVLDLLCDEIMDFHRDISEYFFSGEGIHLQNKDSKIILDVISHFIDKGIPCLSVHDSVIIAEEHEKELETVMKETYSKHMNGFKCNVSKK